ncbi:DUF488 domain-containing protein [Paraflavitalea sp. CAU 1676]|uniref:DUF488 domain-containing protein n=1 Tax=Paraflavitalea sp. CAU 1676 TaxID=3032598 RepID=UPI0023DA7EFC|nr:DUF488 domain-containing protein [Paraflavitalea sp. CAU 1676]MDF2191493.1 DUF488 domain-containing protein [Paraflavitalea sp. CAU 1676]
MFYRRKILLALLELFDGELDKVRLQTLLFLFCQKQAKADYDFVPYKYGCYSYSANADLATMVKRGILADTLKSFQRVDKTSYADLLKTDDLALLRRIKSLYGGMDSSGLMKYTYQNYPYWAIKSVSAKSILTNEELELVEQQRPLDSNTVLFTIGYEGGSLENYLNRLLKNNVAVLVDVRNNPISMKFGFSKGQLKNYCENLDISYMHFPEVGIVSDKRQALNTQADYDRLFADYRKNNLPYTATTQNRILQLLQTKKRIALTCFEANHCQCHRSHLANAISELPAFRYEVKHI